MDFEFSREHQALRKLVREFAEEEVRPAARQADRTSQPSLDVIKKAADIGLLGVPFPREYGGLGAGDQLPGERDGRDRHIVPDAVLAASVFHFGTFTIPQVKSYLRDRGVEVRI